MGCCLAAARAIVQRNAAPMAARGSVESEDALPVVFHGSNDSLRQCPGLYRSRPKDVSRSGGGVEFMRPWTEGLYGAGATGGWPQRKKVLATWLAPFRNFHRMPRRVSASGGQKRETKIGRELAGHVALRLEQLGERKAVRPIDASDIARSPTCRLTPGLPRFLPLWRRG